MPAFLRNCRHWVFDMDGTLTQAVHDFDYIRQQLGIAPQADILEHLNNLPTKQAQAAHDWLMAHERKLAEQAIAAPGATSLIGYLHKRGDRLAILTRNAYELVQVTLQAIGLDHCFSPVAILGREQVTPKPSPEGILKIAADWQVESAHICMVGDFHFDLRSARQAGAKAVLVNQSENIWPELTDFHAHDCQQLLTALSKPPSPAKPNAHIA